MRCIFCGRDTVIQKDKSDEDYVQHTFYVYSKSCCARGPKFKDESFAILTWNSISNIVKEHFDARYAEEA